MLRARGSFVNQGKQVVQASENARNGIPCGSDVESWPGERDFNSPERILKLLENGGTKLFTRSPETGLRFREMNGGSGPGKYFSITDKAPQMKADEFRCMPQGGISVKQSAPHVHDSH